MSLKKQTGELDAKIKALRLMIKKCDEIIANRDKETIERQRISLVSLAREIDQLRGSIQETKFSQGESEEQVETWSEEKEKDLRLADDCANKLQKSYDQIIKEERDHGREEMHEKDLEHEKQLLNQKLRAALKQKELEEKKSTVKLPKLSITPFSGTVIDWVRFDNQFSAMVDSQNVPAVTKFSHLKELLVPKVRQVIDGLPFNEEGYERAKKYLKEKYDHPDEVAGAYVINLLEMPTITERNVAKVHQFYEKLLFTIESLETLGKLESVQGVAYYVLVKKLEFLRSELVSHVPSDWRSWSFKELLESLHKWTDTNTTSSKRSASSDPVFFSEDRHVNNSCVYCDSTEHVSSDCGEISTPEERKAYLVSKRLCFNCAAG